MTIEVIGEEEVDASKLLYQALGDAKRLKSSTGRFILMLAGVLREMLKEAYGEEW